MLWEIVLIGAGMSHRLVSDPRPPLAFRVGVTGSRHLDEAAAAALREPVAAVLLRIRETIEASASERVAKAVYRAGPAADAAPQIRLLSPLAVGSDRLVAEEALKLGYKLYAPLPFSQAEYEKDFQDSVDNFRHLLKQAQVLTLDGGRGRDEAASYEAVGRFVARNCDLLVALWDGVSDDKRGGTGQIMQFAARGAVPIWWIDTTTGEARWITRTAQLRHPLRAFAGASAERALVQALRAIVLPPEAPPLGREGLIARTAHRFHRFRKYETAPLKLFLREGASLPRSGLWRAHTRMQKVLGIPLKLPPQGLDGPKLPTEPQPPHPDLSSLPGPVFWDAIYRRADRLSIDYGDRYRSSYVLVIAIAFGAVVVGTLGSWVKAGWSSALPTLVELTLFGGIGTLVFANRVHLWQERWIAYRLLAELCRKQMVLAILGRTLPGAEVSRSAAEAAADRFADEPAASPGESVVVLPTREAWVGWYFLACQRAAPLPTGDIGTAAERALAVGRDLAFVQRAYHHGRREMAKKVEHRLALIGEVFFLLAGSGLLLRLIVSGFGGPPSVGSWITAGAAILSSLSAAFVGLRAYSEFAVLARQSANMEALMKEAQADLAEVELGPPLASDELGGLLHRLAMAMMQEVRGWAQLFRLKSVETG